MFMLSFIANLCMVFIIVYICIAVGDSGIKRGSTQYYVTNVCIGEEKERWWHFSKDVPVSLRYFHLSRNIVRVLDSLTTCF
jgi:hypothetical protein